MSENKNTHAKRILEITSSFRATVALVGPSLVLFSSEIVSYIESVGYQVSPQAEAALPWIIGITAWLLIWSDTQRKVGTS